ncbi:MAG: hypothetical protein LBJ12_01415 [Oscillospiraceae bacterium]|jgi:hypothetical protein|nr:hypothetical protein [Oscillospiraceae bacterium]
MAILTPNIGLEKPLVTENYDVMVFNRNFDILDKMVARLNNTLFSGDLAYRFLFQFDTLDGIETNGVWNQNLGRIEI